MTCMQRVIWKRANTPSISIGNMNTYTLSQLAHFDRCLYPGDFRHDLESAGLSEFLAQEIAYFIIGENRKGGPHCGIVRLYQEYIDNKEIIAAFEKVLYDFVKTNKKGT